MLDFLRWVTIRREHTREHTKDAARERLQATLVQDRMGVSPVIMESLKNDVLAALRRHLVVGDEFQQFEIQHGSESVVLVSNIRVKELPRWAPAN
jgi:cell division topological specificity factor